MMTGHVLDMALVKEAFEQVLSAYRDHRWLDLMPRVAPHIRLEIRKALDTYGEQHIISSGKIPQHWYYDAAMPVSESKVHVYGLMSTVGKDETMYRRRFIFIRNSETGSESPPWIFYDLHQIGEGAYDKGLIKCSKWAPEYRNEVEPKAREP